MPPYCMLVVARYRMAIVSFAPLPLVLSYFLQRILRLLSGKKWSCYPIWTRAFYSVKSCWAFIFLARGFNDTCYQQDMHYFGWRQPFSEFLVLPIFSHENENLSLDIFERFTPTQDTWTLFFPDSIWQTLGYERLRWSFKTGRRKLLRG